MTAVRTGLDKRARSLACLLARLLAPCWCSFSLHVLSVSLSLSFPTTVAVTLNRSTFFIQLPSCRPHSKTGNNNFHLLNEIKMTLGR